MTEEQREAQRKQEWHLDRNVTVGLILALLVNAAATVWFAAQLEARVTTLEKNMIANMDTPQRITRVETQVESVREYLARIEGKLDRVIETQ